MIIIGPEDSLTHPVCLMIGNFDGIHLGHQAIFNRARAIADEKGCRTAVLSFEPHPLKVLAPEHAPKLLQTRAQKKALLDHYGIDFYIACRFDAALAQLSPGAFIAALRRRVNFAALLVGHKFRFGHNRQGDTQTLRELAPSHGFELVLIEERSGLGLAVSSSRIRAMVSEGRLDEVAVLLGRPYFLEGEVVHGEHLGRKMKAPTANLIVTNELLPAFGVYATWSRVDGQWFRSITNIGIAPTFDRPAPVVETHLFGFESSLYGKRLLVCFGARLRSEIAFADSQTLKNQIAQDFETRLAMTDSTAPDFAIRFEP